MKTQILNYIKESYLTPEENVFSMDEIFKNHTIFLECNPLNQTLELDVWDNLTEVKINFTYKEVNDILEHFERCLENYYREMDFLSDQMNHESYLWNHR